MKSTLWIIGIIISIFLILAVIMIISIMKPLINISEISRDKVKSMAEYELLADGIHIEEICNELDILTSKFRPTENKERAGVKLLQGQDGKLEKFEPFNDPSKEIDALISNHFDYNIAFKNSEVYQITQNKMSALIHKFDNPDFEPFRYFAIINNDFFLMSADLKGVEYAKPILWQLDKTTFEILKITEEPYHTFERPPLILNPNGYTGTIVVYYKGDISFGYGGDSSRPEQSVIRIYDQHHPKGKDIIQMSFAVGTIVNIEMDKKDFLVHTDPSLPSSAGKSRVPPRTWQISIK